MCSVTATSRRDCTLTGLSVGRKFGAVTKFVRCWVTEKVLLQCLCSRLGYVSERLQWRLRDVSIWVVRRLALSLQLTFLLPSGPMYLVVLLTST